MQYYVFKTNIRSKRSVEKVKPIFSDQLSIADWHVDIQDIDHVLRVRRANELREKSVIELIQSCGFHCEPLTN